MNDEAPAPPPIPPAELAGLNITAAEQFALAQYHQQSPLAQDPRIGKSVGQFQINALLGRGGMGVVYKAEDRRLNRVVALKMMSPHAGAQDALRFKREAQAAAKLDNPNIVKIYEMGDHEGTPFLALEFVDGKTLATFLGGTPQPVPSAAAKIVVLARAIHVAHSQGIVHRDLKPANILLNAQETVLKICDFGLAKQRDATTLTSQRDIVGTLPYIAPEQANGQEITAATDVHALGVILYEMLTRQRPYSGDTPALLLNQICHVEPKAPSDLNPSVPTDLGTICLKCLAKEPSHRYATAAELADDLDRFLCGETIVAQRPGKTLPPVSYLRWSLRQLYLLVFRPTQYTNEVEGPMRDQKRLKARDRVRYLVGMFPWIIVLSIFGNVVGGHICELSEIPFRWESSLVGVGLGATVGICAGWLFAGVGLIAGVGGGISFGLGWGVTANVRFGLPDLRTFVFVGGVAGGLIVAFFAAAALGRAKGSLVGLAAVLTLICVGFASLVVSGDTGVLPPNADLFIAGCLECSIVLAMSVGLGAGLYLSAIRALLLGLASGLVLVIAFILVDVGHGTGAGITHCILAGMAFALAFWLTYFRLFFYPFDLAIDCIVFSLRHSHALSSIWRWHPIRWNEVIWLPLPFAGKLLALFVRQEREEGFRQIAFVAADRNLQRRAARRALVEVAIDDLQANSIAELAGVAEKLWWKTNAPAEVPAELSAGLAGFERVAQHAGQYLDHQSPDFKGEALSRALDEIGRLQLCLMATRWKQAPRLLHAANAWQGLLETEGARFRARGEHETGTC